jgi:hypothetical protein
MSGWRASAGSAIVAVLCAAATVSAASMPTPSAASLLPRAGELPGLAPSGAVVVFRSVAAWVKGTDAPNSAAAKRDSETLPEEGFIDGAEQSARASGLGFSAALVFTNSAGAREDTSYAYSSSLAGTRAHGGLNIHPFSVAAISGSQGFAAALSSGAGNTILFFATGRCEIEIFEGAPSLQATITVAGVDLYRRIDKTCS